MAESESSNSRWRLQGKCDHRTDNNQPSESTGNAFLKDHNHVVSGNYRRRENIQKIMVIMGQTLIINVQNNVFWSWKDNGVQRHPLFLDSMNYAAH